MVKRPSITQMCDKFLTESRMPFPGHRAGSPVTPQERPAPIVPQERWQGVRIGERHAMEKRFVFNTIAERNEFVVEAIELEERYQHTASTLITGMTVTVRLITKNVNLPTETDLAMSRYLDQVYAETAFRIDSE